MLLLFKGKVSWRVHTWESEDFREHHRILHTTVAKSYQNESWPISIPIFNAGGNFSSTTLIIIFFPKLNSTFASHCCWSEKSKWIFIGTTTCSGLIHFSGYIFHQIFFTLCISIKITFSWSFYHVPSHHRDFAYPEVSAWTLLPFLSI